MNGEEEKTKRSLSPEHLEKLREGREKYLSRKTVDVRELIPKEWRKTVDKELGEDFRLEIDESSGGNFVLKVILPPHLDRRVGDEKSMSKYDCSTCVIRRASDVADVKKWCSLIKSNIQKIYPDFKK